MINEQLMNEYNERHKIVLTFNKEMLEKYTKHYFWLHPNRKALPLKWLGKTRNGLLPSWNRYINCPSRTIQNEWKTELANYTNYVLEQCGVKPFYYNRAVVVVRNFQPTKAKSDCDNIYIKSSIDACVKWGLLEEDNYTVVRPVILYANYDKSNPRTEIVFYPITKDYPQDVVMELVTHDIKGEA